MSHGDRIVEPPPKLHPAGPLRELPLSRPSATAPGCWASSSIPRSRTRPDGQTPPRQLRPPGMRGAGGSGRRPTSSRKPSRASARRWAAAGSYAPYPDGGRFGSGGRAGPQGRPAASSPAYSLTTALMRRDEPAQVVDAFDRHIGLDLVHVSAAGELPRRARGRYGPGGEAAAHRPGVHRGLRRAGGQHGAGRFPGPGHTLPRRDREPGPTTTRCRRRSRPTTTSAACRRT